MFYPINMEKVVEKKKPKYRKYRKKLRGWIFWKRILTKFFVRRSQIERRKTNKMKGKKIRKRSEKKQDIEIGSTNSYFSSRIHSVDGAAFYSLILYTKKNNKKYPIFSFISLEGKFYILNTFTFALVS